MKSSRKINAVILAGATIGALALAGCSGGGGSNADGEVVLELVQSGDANQGGGYAMLADKYFEETGVRVNVVEVPNSDVRT
ncbi:MAG: hypothetical protein WAK00_11960, partial [Microbacterium sp.]